MKKTIKITAIIIAMALVVTSIFYMNNGAAVQAAAKATKVGNGMYTVTSEKNKTARFDRIASKTKTSLTIPATVKIGKKTYKVTAIKANALKGNRKIKKLTVGKNVKKIGKNAFSGCKNLKTINIKTTKLTLKSVGKNAFKGLNSKVTIKVPASKLAAYQTLLRARGVTGKKQVVKTNGGTSTTSTNKPTALPTPAAELRIGVNNNWTAGKTETDCGVDETVKLTIRTDIPLEFYGYWEKVKGIKSDFMSTCTACQHVVASNEDRVIHGLQSGHDGYTVRTKGNYSFDANVWHADNTPCSIVYHITLPEGLEVVENSISVAQLTRLNTLMDAVDSSNYQVSLQGGELTISIVDIKAGGFCFSDGDIKYQPIIASFSAKVTDSASTVNTINASVSYKQGQDNKSVTTNNVIINKK